METLLYREALIESAKDVSKGVRLSASSESLVLRKDKKLGVYYERLSHGPGDCMLNVLNTQGVLLENHDDKKEIGTITPGTVRIEADKKLRANVKISDAKWRGRIEVGERPAVSIGYVQLSIVKRSRADDGVPILTWSWAPHEISLLTADKEPADATVGIGRSKNKNMDSIEKLLALALSGSRKADGETFTREQLTEDFSLLAEIQRQAFRPGEDRSGIARAINESERYIAGELTDCFTRWESLLPAHRRDMQVDIFGAGGALVQPDMQPVVELLWNRVAAIPLGATVFSGLQGASLFPRVTSAPTPQMLSEIAGLAASGFNLDQAALAPCRCTVQIPISLQLIKQTGGGAETLVKRQIAQAIAVEMDRLIFTGQGAYSEPLGLFQTPGVGAVAFGGPADWPHVLQFEKALSLQNADIDNNRLGWAISPLTRNSWKQKSRIAATNYPSFIMEDGEVNDYPALTTNQLAGNEYAVFGAWSDLFILIWGNGFDLLVDGVTQANTGKCIITCNFWFNSFPCHPQAFCASTDSAAQ